MRCDWQAYLRLLPHWLRNDADKHKDTLQELRLRLDQPPELVCSTGTVWLTKRTSREDLQRCVNMASEYSPWAASTVARGYLTAPGGHRIGVCGDVIEKNGSIQGLRSISSLCLRVARDFPSIGKGGEHLTGSLLIIGKPGSGKTTLLRDLIRIRSNSGMRITVIDEREELFPFSGHTYTFPTGICTDVLSGCKKPLGIDAALRCMSPDVIAVDEITAKEDCDALLHALWCGVDLMATAHAGSRDELFQRPLYKPIVQSGLFRNLLVLNRDKSWSAERMDICQ